MRAIVWGARLARRRLARATTIVGVGAALLAVVIVAALERRALPLLAADRVLSGIGLGVALPLLAYGVVGRACGDARLDVAVLELARHGANRRRAALGLLSGVALSLGFSGAVIAVLGVFVTRFPADPRLLSDLATSSWIGALAGVAYAALFVLSSTIGGRGGGRFWALALDWVLGAGTSAAALPWPRSHVKNLLGSDAVLALPQWGSALALGLLATFMTVVALRRCPP